MTNLSMKSHDPALRTVWVRRMLELVKRLPNVHDEFSAGGARPLTDRPSGNP